MLPVQVELTRVAGTKTAGIGSPTGSRRNRCLAPHQSEESEHRNRDTGLGGGDKTTRTAVQGIVRSSEAEIDPAFTILGQAHVGVLVIGADTLFAGQAGQLGALSVRNSVPAIFDFHPFVEAGGL